MKQSCCQRLKASLRFTLVFPPSPGHCPLFLLASLQHLLRFFFFHFSSVVMSVRLLGARFRCRLAWLWFCWRLLPQDLKILILLKAPRDDCINKYQPSRRRSEQVTVSQRVTQSSGRAARGRLRDDGHWSCIVQKQATPCSKSLYHQNNSEALTQGKIVA